MRFQRSIYSPGVVVLLLSLFAHFEGLHGRAGLGIAQEGSPSPGVKLIQPDARHVVMSNGIVNLTLTKPDGDIAGVTYKGSVNLLETEYEEFERGRWNMVWNGLGTTRKGKAILDGLQGTNYTVIVENENQVEISFTAPWKSGPLRVPLNVDKRFVMLKGCPGFYTYAIFEHPKESPTFGVQVGRLVFKLEGDKFHYMSISDLRQRYMPTAADRLHGKTLSLKEAVLLTNPRDPAFKGEVDDKYFYACDNKDSRVHGWVSNDTTPLGFWMITPSNEFRAGGPFKQDLTSHTETTSLVVFSSRHYVGLGIDLRFEKGEDWRKVIGPVFIYLNSDVSASKNPSVLWTDAKKRMEEETASWPYEFPVSRNFIKSNGRGTVSGKFLVFDRLVQPNAVPAASAYVGLAAPGDAGSWQVESKMYQFWTQITDGSGKFEIKNVVPGTYTLFGLANGTLGEYVHHPEITITPGCNINLGDLVYEPPRGGPTLWEIGIPDRTAVEFFVPDPSPKFKVHKFGNVIEKFKQYGLWARYEDLYPTQDLVFTIGTSDYTKDWFYAQVTRKAQAGKYTATTWQIKFDLPNVDAGANYTLQLALASGENTDLEVRFNDPKAPPVFVAITKGKDNGVARYGDHGIYHSYSIGVKGSTLKPGQNIIYFSITNPHEFTEVMYDYIRFEGPPASKPPA